MKSSSVATSLVLLLGLAACAAKSNPDPDGIKVVSADSDSGLEVRYVDGDLAFTLKGHNDGIDVYSSVIGADGSVITQSMVPTDIGAYGGDKMMLKVGALAASQGGVDAERYLPAIERIVAHLAHANDSYIDANFDIPMHQVLLLTAIANPGVSMAAVCPEYLANPGESEYHTVAMHQAVLDSLPKDQKPQTLSLWLAVCLYHDLACWASKCEPRWACGGDCQPGLQCPGRCGGGCGSGS